MLSGNSVQISLLLSSLKFLADEHAAISQRLNHQRATTRVFPDEVLEKIFFFLCPPGTVFRRARGSKSLRLIEVHTTADLRRASQVCSVWRSVAVTSPALWSILNCNDEALPWLEELLRRCGTFPIHVVADFSQLPYPLLNHGAAKAVAMIDTVLPPPNIGSVSVVLDYNMFCPVRPIVERFISDRCTSATRMSLSTSYRHFPEGWVIPTGVLPNLNNQRLRQLEVKGYRPDLTLPCFRQLASLEVSYLSGITAREWIRVLTGLPELAHLRLNKAISSGGGGGSTVFRDEDRISSTIHLPSLKTLALIGNFDDGIGDILLAMDGRTPRYSLLLQCKLFRETDLSMVIRSLRTWFEVWNVDFDVSSSSSSSARPSRRVDVLATRSRFWLDNRLPGNERSNEWFRIYFNWGHLWLDLARLLNFQTDIFDVFGPVLSETKTLSVSMDKRDQGYVCCPEFWQTFPSVETLRFVNSGSNQAVDDSAAGLFVDALCNDVERSLAGNPLPKLWKLSFEWNDSLDYPFVFEGDVKRLARLLSCQIRLVELYACTSTDGIGILVGSLFCCPVTVTDLRSP